MASSRVDIVTTANAAIGTGHLRRCLTLADALRTRGLTSRFLLYRGDPAMSAWIREAGHDSAFAGSVDFAACMTAIAAPAVVVDSYDIGRADLDALLARGHRTLVMDDLVDRPLPATWLLNSCETDATAYRGLTSARLLLGPRYALVRPQFRSLPARSVAGPARRILLTFGGSDILRLGHRILGLLEPMEGPFEIRLVAGPLAAAPIPAVARGAHVVEVLCDVAAMADLMRWADLAIAAAGQTIFELAAAGCPALCLQVADNQRRTGDLFSTIGSAVVLDARTAGDGELRDEIRGLVLDGARRDAMSVAGRRAVDGLGAGRVAEILAGAEARAGTSVHVSKKG